MDLPLIDSETAAEMSLAELYAVRQTLRARMGFLQEQLNVVNRVLSSKPPTRFGETVMLPAPKKWSPYDKTYGAVRHWCGEADAFLSIVGISYVRVTGLFELAKERAIQDGADEDKAKRTAEGVVNALGSRVPAGDYPTFVPLEKAPKKYHALPDALADGYQERPTTETGADLLDALRTTVGAQEAREPGR